MVLLTSFRPGVQVFLKLSRRGRRSRLWHGRTGWRSGAAGGARRGDYRDDRNRDGCRANFDDGRVENRLSCRRAVEAALEGNGLVDVLPSRGPGVLEAEPARAPESALARADRLAEWCCRRRQARGLPGRPEP